MENHTQTNHQVIVTNLTEAGIELHVLRIYMPNKPEQEESTEPDPATTGNVPSPPPPGMPIPRIPGGITHSNLRASPSPQHRAQSRGYSQVQPSTMGYDLSRFAPFEVQTEYSHSVLVKNGEVSYIEKDDICNELKPILISHAMLETTGPLCLYVFTARGKYAPEDRIEGEPECQEFSFGVDIADPYVRMISVKYGFYDTLLAVYYIRSGCNLACIPSPTKSALHVYNNLGGGFVIPFEDKYITQRLAYSPFLSHVQHVSSKIVLSVLDNVKLNDGELLLINLRTVLDYRDPSMYTVTTEISTVSKDMSISEFEDEVIRIGIINGHSSGVDTSELYQLLFTMRMEYRPYTR